MYNVNGYVRPFPAKSCGANAQRRFIDHRAILSACHAMRCRVCRLWWLWKVMRAGQRRHGFFLPSSMLSVGSQVALEHSLVIELGLFGEFCRRTYQLQRPPNKKTFFTQCWNARAHSNIKTNHNLSKSSPLTGVHFHSERARCWINNLY